MKYIRDQDLEMNSDDYDRGQGGDSVINHYIVGMCLEKRGNRYRI